MRNASIVKFVLVIGLVALSLGSALVFFSETKQLKSRLRQSDDLFQKMRKESARLETEKAQIAKEHESLQNDVVSYVAQNTKLQEEADQLRAKLTDSEEQLKDRENELQRVQAKLEKLHKEMVRSQAEKRKAVASEFNDLTQKIASLESSLKHERSLYQYNLGVVYAQVQRYDEAIDAYTKSLELNPKNPDAHYNLGLLYERVKGQPDKAVWSYRKYLELNPQAEDRDEVLQWIDRLTASVQ